MTSRILSENCAQTSRKPLLAFRALYVRAFCMCSLEVTVTSLHPPRLCRLAVFSIKPTLLSSSGSDEFKPQTQPSSQSPRDIFNKTHPSLIPTPPSSLQGPVSFSLLHSSSASNYNNNIIAHLVCVASCSPTSFVSSRFKPRERRISVLLIQIPDSLYSIIIIFLRSLPPTTHDTRVQCRDTASLRSLLISYQYSKTSMPSILS